MTSEEIRKLLGGYATNTLTESERKTLFEAALDDQELFNALQDEEALRDLLADPFSRAQLQRALQAPARPPVSWWNRRWAWASGLSAVAAAALIVGVIRMNQSEPPLAQQTQSIDLVKTREPNPQPPPEQDKARATEASKPPAKGSPASARSSDNKPGRLADEVATLRKDGQKAQNEKKEEAPAGAVAGRRDAKPPAVASPSPAPPPPPPASAVRAAESQPAQNQAQVRQAQNSNSQPSPSQNAAQNFIPSPVTVNPGAAMDSTVHTAVLRYVVIRRDSRGEFTPVQPTEGLKRGDQVRLSVTPLLPGVLSLDRVEAGEPLRIFPPVGSGITVVANSSYLIPDAPIEVNDTDQKFRLSLAPPTAGGGAATFGGLARSRAEVRAKTAAPGAAIPPQTVEITIRAKQQ